MLAQYVEDEIKKENIVQAKIKLVEKCEVTDNYYRNRYLHDRFENINSISVPTDYRTKLNFNEDEIEKTNRMPRIKKTSNRKFTRIPKKEEVFFNGKKSELTLNSS